ncbi:hypothetical protein [Ferruginibacter sp. HRS2-29]|uniref:hypothetical protein n=1 Tax=Ferruginibacter sp. HRS2-29 TaxID=2487334 RepID=UPI0020CC91E4|nr:hypothetical protein [Ferruginibacter sp. HRS2-29]MCP9750903.1 hypothetical protein [Ferruginibacter sp. HRS2-29]
MKNSFLAYFIFFAASAYAQTPETKFLQKKEYRWAAYISDTIHFSSPNLSLLVRQQADAGKIKVAHPTFDNHVYQKYYQNKEQLQAGGAACVLSVPIFDSLGNIVNDIPVVKSLLFDNIAFDSVMNDQVFVEQFLYIKKNKLLSHVSWISPKKKVVTAGGTYLGNTLVFNAYYNTTESISKRTRKKAISLGTTNRILTDSSLQSDMTKQWYNENFATALWPALAADNIDIYRIDSSKKIEIGEINGNLLGYSIDVPVYDDAGYLINSKPVLAPLTPSTFTKIMLIQEWYYNASKEVVFNDIKEVILYAVKNNNSESTPVLRIIFRH